MANKFSVAGGRFIEITGQLNDIERQLRLGLEIKGNLCPYDPELISLALQNVIEGRFTTKSAENKFLKRIFPDENLTLKALDGTATIARAKDTFKSYIDSDFKSWGTDKKGIATEETPVNVYEMIQNATLLQMFGSLSNDFDSLCLTQHQIIEFCNDCTSCLRQDGFANFFLFKVNDQFFVPRVVVISVGLDVRVHRLEDASVWNADFRRRVGVQQLVNA